MQWQRAIAATLLSLLLALPSPAGIFFGKKPPAKSPQERIPELITILKTDGDENKRCAAAEELRTFETQAHPEIVAILIEVLQNDAKPSVRAEAAQSLGKIRPITLPAGQALEQALAKDASMRVR